MKRLKPHQTVGMTRGQGGRGHVWHIEGARARRGLCTVRLDGVRCLWGARPRPFRDRLCKTCVATMEARKAG